MLPARPVLRSGGAGVTGPLVCCDPVADRDPGAEQAAAVARLLAALADPVRLRLYALTAAAGPDGVCVCDLTGPVGRSQPTVSHHLKLLADAGLIVRERRGRYSYATVVDERRQQLAALLG